MRKTRTPFSDVVRLFLLGVIIAGGVPAAQAFRRDEVECEEAVAMLEECCDGFDASKIACDYIEGCDESTYPSIAPYESECIRALSCSEVRDAKICDRVLARATDANAQGEVCP